MEELAEEDAAKESRRIGKNRWKQMAVQKKKEDIASRYRERIARELGIKRKTFETKVTARTVAEVRKYSSNYEQFKRENIPKRLSLYEKACNFSGKILSISPDRKSAGQMQKRIDLAHLDTTPGAVISLGVMFMAAFLLLGVAVWLVTGFLIILAAMILVGLLAMMAVMKMPEFFSNNWRLQSSNQMVQCIFYMAAFMRHTSNIELAVRFAAERLSPPLSLDLKKVIWDVETDKFETIKESLDDYLETWRDWNSEFIESLHLLEGSLYEPSEDKRITMIDKALNLMLEETYEKMLRYAHDLKGPVTMLYMLGLVLPILGLVILPMVASFMTSSSNPLLVAGIIAVLYNVALPVVLFYLTKVTLSNRPTGYGEMDITEQIPSLRKYRSIVISLGSRDILISPLMISLIVGGVLLFIGLLPWAFQFFVAGGSEALLNPDEWHNVPLDFAFGFKILDYRLSSLGDVVGPYGMGAGVLSFFVTSGAGIGVAMYYMLRSRNVFKIREKAQKLEDEFASSLFNLGNRIGDGVPVEVAVGKVAVMMKGTSSADFFRLINNNITNRGMSFERAVFDPKNGAIAHFPSPVIESAMKILMESSRKGPKSASSALINVSEYIKDIHRVNQRLQDLMADIISDMKQQVGILAPAIAAIVVGITSMIIGILGSLSDQIKEISAVSDAGQVPSGLLDLFGEGIPTYYFQIIIGIYVLQIIYIMSLLITGVESGSDKLSERYTLGTNLFRGTILYTLIALTMTVVFNAIASSIVGSITAGP